MEINTRQGAIREQIQPYKLPRLPFNQRKFACKLAVFPEKKVFSQKKVISLFIIQPQRASSLKASKPQSLKEPQRPQRPPQASKKPQRPGYLMVE